ncbi:DUF1697 domain-containing protein [Streptococcus marmotae]|uniref:DUF1697 domain-containing protein n=1 Tax=Streptococcus marmotae TaxID=1825069 RepID=UPI00082EB2F1|nr:DUF1697 domain-containing protein [Streptococcus marmotae]
MSKKVILLRGVTPTGQNRIPKMSYLVEILQKVGFEEVKTYIQSGNIVLQTTKSDEEIKQTVHDVIREKIGADLAVVVKTPQQLERAAAEQPFDDSHDRTRIHLVFTNDTIAQTKLDKLLQEDFGDEKLVQGSECLYLYLPRDAKKKRLYTNYLEKYLGSTMTARKLSVVERLMNM